MISLTVAAAVMSATLSSADVPAPPIGQQVRDGDPQQAAIEVAKGDNGFRRAVPPKPVAEDVDDVHARPMEVYALNPPADAPQRLANRASTSGPQRHGGQGARGDPTSRRSWSASASRARKVCSTSSSTALIQAT